MEAILKLRIFVCAIILYLVLVGTGSAFHGSGLVCNRCHTMHYSENGESPPLTGFGPDIIEPLDNVGDYGADPGGPFPHLIIKEYSTDLCLMCHMDGLSGDGETPDVAGINVYGSSFERAAGFFGPVDAGGNPTGGNPVRYPEDPTTDIPNGHNLGAGKTLEGSCANSCHYRMSYGPDSFPTLEVGCLDCHDPHGRDTDNPNYSYRNLQVNSHMFGSATLYGSGPPYPQIKAIVNPDPVAIVDPVDVYRQENIGYVTPTYGYSSPFDPSEWREVTNVCLHCHPRFSGYTAIGTLSSTGTRQDGGSDGICIRHPNTESARDAWEPIDRLGGTAAPAHWALGEYGWEPANGGNGIGFPNPADPSEIAPSRLPFLVQGMFGGTPEENYTDATEAAEDNQVFCLTCHKAHGSTNNSSMRWDYRTNSNRGCQQCHNKGN